MRRRNFGGGKPVLLGKPTIKPRQKNADVKKFEIAFERDYKRVVIIGSDCKDLSNETIRQAYEELKKNDVVIGPAKDGGYYLLGMNSFYPELFENKQWSTENVMLDTILDVKKLGLKYSLLQPLSDVDYKEDLGELKN